MKPPNNDETKEDNGSLRVTRLSDDEKRERFSAFRRRRRKRMLDLVFAKNPDNL